MHNTRFVTQFLTAAILLTTMSGANAAVLTWSLNGVIFDDGTTAVGSFDYDADAGVYDNVNIAVMAGTFSAYTYQDSNIFIGSNDASMVDFVDAGVTRYLRLEFAAPLDNAGGLRTLLTANMSFECDNCTNFRYITAGTVNATVIPIPAALWLMSGALAGLFGLARKPAAASR